MPTRPSNIDCDRSTSLEIRIQELTESIAHRNTYSPLDTDSGLLEEELESLLEIQKNNIK